MPAPKATLRDRVKDMSPTWLREGVNERLQYSYGLAEDAIIDKMSQGGLARFPTRAQPDANTETGRDRLITKGITEGDESYAARLQRAFITWQFAGSGRSVLSQELGYLLALTPQILEVSVQYTVDRARVQRMLLLTLGIGIHDVANTTPITVTTKGPHGFSTGNTVRVTGVATVGAANGNHVIVVIDDVTFTLNGTTAAGVDAGTGRVVLNSLIPSATYPPTRNGTTWITYAAGADPSAEPTTVRVGSGGLGDWNWDGSSQVNDSWIWWGTFIVVNSVAPNAWIGPAAAWGSGAVWGAGSQYTPSLAVKPWIRSYYSGIVGGTYASAGSYMGYSTGWGVDASAAVGLSMMAIATQFKAAHTVLRELIISFDATLFNVAHNAGGGVNPDGTFGRWSKVTGGAYAPSRFAAARYCGGTT